ncbi:MAG: CZB domain-containing protein [Gemmatimonadaceae bacterium]|nr:CZB domain-containing protein [Gemmatimonadaceae bacterium]
MDRSRIRSRSAGALACLSCLARRPGAAWRLKPDPLPSDIQSNIRLERGPETRTRAPHGPSEHPGEQSMDLEQAIQAHAQWRMKLRTAIARREPMDVATIGKDNACELGKWLHTGARAACGNCDGFAHLVATHARFHTEAAKVATLINAQRFDEAERQIGADSAFVRASKEVGVAIVRVKQSAGRTAGV